MAEPRSRTKEPSAKEPPAAEEFRPYQGIRRLIWIYLFLLLIEGALRKWVFPQYSNQLLIVRDPVLALIYLAALQQGVFPKDPWVMTLLCLGAVTAIAAPFAEQAQWMVALFGLRTNFFHLPLIFLMPKVFDQRDVDKLGRVLLTVAVPMALLVSLQFNSPGSAWVNVGAGGGENGQLSVAYGRIRPPGTFSFTTGLAAYLSLCVAFLINSQLRTVGKKTRLLYIGGLATGLMVGLSGSRTTLTSGFLVFLAAVYVCFRNPALMQKGLRTAFLIFAAFLLLQVRTEFRQGLLVHEYRLGGSSGVTEGIGKRILYEFTDAFAALNDTPLLGKGLGVGTTAGGSLLTGERSFLVAETEWLRVLGESGPILGLAFLAWRVGAVLILLRVALNALRSGNSLPLLLFATAAPLVLNGQLGIATTLGFTAIGGGLCLAAANLPRGSDDTHLFRVSPNSVTAPHKVRGRSIYAEKLHTQGKSEPGI